MPKPRLVRLAESWAPDPDDKYGEDKRRLIRFLLENDKSAFNPVIRTFKTCSRRS